jgi:hypothetical protein
MRAKTRIILNVNVYFCYPILTKIVICPQILVKLYNISRNENPFSDSRVVIADRRADGQTDMAKLIVAFLQLFVANSSKTYGPSGR